ncbi:helix-turn-helix transcriptional regulator [Sphaerobacter sp.]|uniref:helix-turn-helix domain-containing protein n=1 Tax=Sphaerobacter sp. TaxID=2099654 RepID=UPI001D9DCE4A|nr:helix-turn-helix transcriptional regulator [Sphaerobacter sp.]MBX5444490.1 helix-turn-helix transcriptional regulator [Sphaerobacter sp.]
MAGQAPSAAPTFAELLKRFREEARTSQSRLAESAGFDHSYVSRLESGNRTPTREAVVKLADALGLTPEQRDSLLAAAGYMPQRVESLLADEPILSEVLQLLQSRDIPEPIRQNVRQMLRLMVNQAQMAAIGWPSGPDTSPDAMAAD